MMDQTHIGYTSWQQPNSNVMPALTYPAKNNSAAPGIFVDGGSTNTLPPMDPYGQTRWIDVYSKSNTTATFTLTSDSWVKLTPSSGTLNPPATADQRVVVSIDWAAAPKGSSTSSIKVSAGNSAFTITLPLSNNVVPSSFSGFVASDGTVAIEPEHFATSDSAYSVIPGSGKTLSGVTLLPASLPTQKAPGSPKMTYNLYSFTAGSASVSVTLSSALNHDPSRPLSYALAINSDAITTCQYVPVTDLGTLPSVWETAVQDAGWTYTSKHNIVAVENILSLWLLEPGVVVQRIVVNLGGVRTSYLGPPESIRVGSE